MFKKTFKVSMFLLLMVVMVLGTAQCTPQPTATEAAAPVEATKAPAEATVAVEAPTEVPVVEKPYDGVEISLASMTDQYIAAFRYLIPMFKEETGITITMDELGYTDLYQKLTADFVGHTASYDLMTMDIVWSGEYAANKYTVKLNDWIDRDKEELNLDDILPVMWTQGEYNDEFYAFPLGGYANVLNYRKDVFEAKGIKPPTTQEELMAAAKALNDPANDFYGIALLGAGSAGAQDYMAFVQQHGGTLYGDDDKIKVNSEDNVAILEFFGELFKYAPAGSYDYWWDQRETAFRTGKVAMMEGWSIARNDYEDPEMSSVVGKVDMTYAPVSEGMDLQYGFGGWGIGINADSDTTKQEAAWEFIKWLASPEVQVEWVLHRGPPLRTSTMTDPAIVEKMPWMPIMLESFQKGNGDYRPRIPQYTIIQDALATHVNGFLTGQKSAQQALDDAQAQIEQNWQ